MKQYIRAPLGLLIKQKYKSGIKHCICTQRRFNDYPRYGSESVVLVCRHWYMQELYGVDTYNLVLLVSG